MNTPFYMSETARLANIFSRIESAELAMPLVRTSFTLSLPTPQPEPDIQPEDTCAVQPASRSRLADIDPLTGLCGHGFDAADCPCLRGVCGCEEPFSCCLGYTN